MELNRKEALRLAGRLASAAGNVLTTTNPLMISERLQELSTALDEYETYIIAFTKQEIKKSDN